MVEREEIAALVERLRLRGQRIAAAARGPGLDQHANLILERAKANAPVRTGALRDSIQIQPEVDDDRRRSVLISATVPYAIQVHERPPNQDEAHRDEATPEGHPGSKYLTRPMHAHQPEFAQAVGVAVKPALVPEAE